MTSPKAITNVLPSLVDEPLLLGVVGVGEDLELIGAVGSEDQTTQDTCLPSIDLPTTTFDNPRFTVGPRDSTLPINGVLVPFYDLKITGTFAADGGSFSNGTISGTMDARDLVAAIPGFGTTGEEMYILTMSFGTNCEACEDGELLCLDVEAEQITANKVDGTLIEIPASGCPGCDVGEPVCE